MKDDVTDGNTDGPVNEGETDVTPFDEPSEGV